MIGIDLLVTLKNEENANKIDDEKDGDEMHSEMDTMEVTTEMRPDEINECAGLDAITETRTVHTSMEDNCDDDDDDSSSEPELTNLGWLIDLKNLAQWPVDANTSNRKNANSHSSLVNGISNCIMNDIDDEESSTAPAISEKDLSEERFKKFTIQVKQ